MGAICLFDGSNLDAQVLAPEVGKVESERIYKPAQPTTDRLTSTQPTFIKVPNEPETRLPFGDRLEFEPQTESQFKLQPKSQFKLQTESQFKLQTESQFKPQTESQFKPQSTAAVAELFSAEAVPSPEAVPSFETSIAAPKQQGSASASFKNLPTKSPEIDIEELVKKYLPENMGQQPAAREPEAQQSGAQQPVAEQPIEQSVATPPATQPVATPPADVAQASPKKTIPKASIPKAPIPKAPIPKASIPNTASSNSPTVIFRPSVFLPDHQSDCVFEINEIESSNDVSLKVAIPDSVTMIEVVPNRESNARRNFRIRMDQGTDVELARRLPTPERPALETPEPQPNPADPAMSSARQARGYSKNPFFIENAGQRVAQRVAEKIAPGNDNRQRSSGNFNLNKKQEGVRGFLKRTSHASANQSPEHFAMQELSYAASSEQSLAHSFTPQSPVIAAQIVGPTHIDVTQTADFMIAIVNPLNTTNRNLEVELDVPKGLKIVLLEKAADFNERTRTLHWRVKEIKPGEEARLQYRVKSLRPGKQLQRVAVRTKDDLVDRHEILTIARMNLDAGASELPFE